MTKIFYCYYWNRGTSKMNIIKTWIFSFWQKLKYEFTPHKCTDFERICKAKIKCKVCGKEYINI